MNIIRSYFLSLLISLSQKKICHFYFFEKDNVAKEYRIKPLLFFSAFLSLNREQTKIAFNDVLTLLKTLFFKIRLTQVTHVKSDDKTLPLKKPYNDFILDVKTTGIRQMTSDNIDDNINLFIKIFSIAHQLYFINGLTDYLLLINDHKVNEDKTLINRVTTKVNNSFELSSVDVDIISDTFNLINGQLTVVFSEFLDIRSHLILPKSLRVEDSFKNYSSYQQMLNELEEGLNNFEETSQLMSGKIQQNKNQKFEEIIMSDMLYDDIKKLNDLFLSKKIEVNEKLSTQYLLSNNLSLFTGWCSHFLKRIIYLHSVSIDAKKDINTSESLANSNVYFLNFSLEDKVEKIYSELNIDNNETLLTRVGKKIFELVNSGEKQDFQKNCDIIIMGLACLQLLNAMQNETSIKKQDILKLSDRIIQFVLTNELPIKLIKSYNDILQSFYVSQLQQLESDKLQWSKLIEAQPEKVEKNKGKNVFKKIKGNISPFKSSKETKNTEPAMTFQENCLFKIKMQIELVNELKNEVRFFRKIEEKWGDIACDKAINSTYDFSESVEVWITSIEKGFAKSLKAFILPATSTVSYDNNSNLLGVKQQLPPSKNTNNDDRANIFEMLNV